MTCVSPSLPFFVEGAESDGLDSVFLLTAPGPKRPPTVLFPWIPR